MRSTRTRRRDPRANDGRAALVVVQPRSRVPALRLRAAKTVARDPRRSVPRGAWAIAKPPRNRIASPNGAPMPLSLELEWTLVACGLVALADGVLKGGEAGKVLDKVHALVAPEEQDDWIDDISSRDGLERRLASLAVPPPESHEHILRQGWGIALVDGEGSVDEARVLEQIGERLGRPRDEVATWRKLWTSEAVENASHVAGFAALHLHRRAAASPQPGHLPGPEDREAFVRLLARLPLSEPRRQRLLKLLDEAGSIEDLGNALLWLGPERRDAVLQEIASYIRTSGAGQLGRQLFLALAARMAVRDDLALRYLDG